MDNSNNNDKNLALITGASQGLGLVAAQFLAEQGYDLIITARHAEVLQETADSLEASGVRVTAMAGDVADPLHRERLGEVLKSYGRLDLLLNNASTLGTLPMKHLLESDIDGLRQTFEVNTFAPLALVQIAQPYLTAAGGLVVNLTSDAANGGYAGWGGYGSSKAALELISLTLANELEAEGVSVVTVDPGDMRTAMHQDAFPGEDISDRPTPDVTIPFWAWLFGQDPQEISGSRFEAQGDIWQVTA